MGDASDLLELAARKDRACAKQYTDPLEKRIQQLTDELQWLQDNHVRVCSRKSKLDLRIQQLTDGINRAGAYLSQGESNLARETLTALLKE